MTDYNDWYNLNYDPNDPYPWGANHPDWENDEGDENEDSDYYDPDYESDYEPDSESEYEYEYESDTPTT